MNIEEIKKELLELNIHECDIEDIFETLDKYNNQQTLVTLKDFENVSNNLIDYKNAFQELIDIQEENEKNAVNCGSCLELIKELSQKYNIGSK